MSFEHQIYNFPFRLASVCKKQRAEAAAEQSLRATRLQLRPTDSHNLSDSTTVRLGLLGGGNESNSVRLRVHVAQAHTR